MRPRQTEPVTSWASGIRFLWKLLSAWWWPTVILGGLYIALSVYGYYLQYGLTPIEMVIATIGTLSAVAFLKTAWLLMTYPLVCRAKFEGSLLFMTALVTTFLVIALMSVAGVAALRGADMPHAELPWLFAGAYLFVTITLWLLFVAAHRVLEK